MHLFLFLYHPLVWIGLNIFLYYQYFRLFAKSCSSFFRLMIYLAVKFMDPFPNQYRVPLFGWTPIGHRRTAPPGSIRRSWPAPGLRFHEISSSPSVIGFGTSNRCTIDANRTAWMRVARDVVALYYTTCRFSDSITSASDGVRNSRSALTICSTMRRVLLKSSS